MFKLTASFTGHCIALYHSILFRFRLLKILLNQKKIAEERKQEGGRGHPVVKKEIKIIQLDNFGQFIVSFFLSFFLHIVLSFYMAVKWRQIFTVQCLRLTWNIESTLHNTLHFTVLFLCRQNLCPLPTFSFHQQNCITLFVYRRWRRCIR